MPGEWPCYGGRHRRLRRLPPKVTASRYYRPSEPGLQARRVAVLRRPPPKVTTATTEGYGESLIPAQRAGPSGPASGRCLGEVPPRGRGAHSGAPGVAPRANTAGCGSRGTAAGSPAGSPAGGQGRSGTGRSRGPGGAGRAGHRAGWLRSAGPRPARRHRVCPDRGRTPGPRRLRRHPASPLPASPGDGRSGAGTSRPPRCAHGPADCQFWTRQVPAVIRRKLPPRNRRAGRAAGRHPGSLGRYRRQA